MRHFRRHADALAQRGVRMNRLADVHCVSTHLDGQCDLADHVNPDTPLHKLGEGLLKAEALAGAPLLAALKSRLAAFPCALGRAMVEHFLATPTPWRAIAQIVHRDTPLWCRDLQVDAVYRLLGALAGLNGRYYTRFQVKRLHKLGDGFALAPPRLAERIEAILDGPVHAGFEGLHALEGDVVALAIQELPDVDVVKALERRGAWPGGSP